MHNDVETILNNIPHPKRQKDASWIVTIIAETLKVAPLVWDKKVIGFGDYHYVNNTNEGDMPILGVVAAKAHVTVYFTVSGLDPYVHLLDRIGQYRRGKICLYISNMEKIDLDVFNTLITSYYQDVVTGKIRYE